jgi:hypothetical protein
MFSFFVQVDWQTFMTLTDEDLKELGVTTFGARRKLLLAIAGKDVLHKLEVNRISRQTRSVEHAQDGIYLGSLWQKFGLAWRE